MIKGGGSHADTVERQFGDRAGAYLSSSVHAEGDDLRSLADLLASRQDGRLLDMGCGAGHASFIAAGCVADVTAYDLSQSMLDIVQRAAHDRGLSNITTRQGVVESLPFTDGAFDVVISRYSAHHWRDAGLALREASRVLKSGGLAVFMDVASPGYPVYDIYLQTVEMLRDTSHVRDYSPGEWLSMLTEAGLTVRATTAGRLRLEFQSWIERMRTPDHFSAAIRALQQSVSDDTIRYYAIEGDGSFTVDTVMVTALKP